MPGNEEHPEILPNHPPTGTHISTLPHDLLVLIFSFLVGADQDLATLRGTLLTCRAFSAAIRSESLWARIAAQFWPGTLQLETWPTWQAMVTTRPRVLFYGVYISKVSYMRQGEQNMMQTYRPCALVEYYRYLRLRTDGTAISVVTHEPPAAVVARMGSEATAARAFGVECLLGTWQRDGDAVHVLLDRANTYGTWRSDMSLHIVPAGPRPNARLKWMAYTLAKLPDGVPEPLTLNDHYRPFVFSRVRHFAHHSEPPVQ